MTAAFATTTKSLVEIVVGLNTQIGYLHGCLKTRSHYNEHTAWAHRRQQTLTAA